MESTKELWAECLTCENKCCKWNLAFPLFVTNAERESLPEVNSNYDECVYYKNRQCSVYDKRPVDCRFFPLDIMKFKEKFFWIIWKVNCPIASKGKEKLELIMQEHEQKLIPRFKRHLEEYSQWQSFLDKYKFEVLREIKIA